MVQWLRCRVSNAGMWVQSLVRELRSHMWSHTTKKKKKQPTNKNEPTTENQMIKTCVSEMKAKRCYIMYLFRNTSHIVKVSSIGIYNHWIQETYTKIYVQNICTKNICTKIEITFAHSEKVRKLKKLKTLRLSSSSQNVCFFTYDKNLQSDFFLALLKWFYSS